ncbi:MAG TPA: PIN domain-containing protein [Anaerolineae bacterium]|nr:PIN domain-containing protein [Anaerolineae bacterium]HQI84880.1 PIN domain-containing protein [Anaerolineae bacterium]
MYNRRALFVDTGGWLGVLDPKDKYHPQAADFFRRALSAYNSLVTTNLVIAETYINIRRSSSHEKAIAFLDLIEKSGRIHCVWSDDELEMSAREVLRLYHDQDFSYTDAVSFAVMQRDGIRDVFAFDQHFRTMGFVVLPA